MILVLLSHLLTRFMDDLIFLAVRWERNWGKQRTRSRSLRSLWPPQRGWWPRSLTVCFRVRLMTRVGRDPSDGGVGSVRYYDCVISYFRQIYVLHCRAQTKNYKKYLLYCSFVDIYSTPIFLGLVVLGLSRSPKNHGILC